MKFALIGASTIAAQWMINAIRAQPDCDVIDVFSNDAEHVKNYAKSHGLEHFSTDLQQLLARTDIDAVYISSTNEKHHPQAMAAMAAGKHVICEKPISMTIGEAAEMVQTAESAGVILATNHHLRSAGAHIKIRNLIHSGRLGKLLSIRIYHAIHLPEHLRGWRIADARAGGGIIADITVHDADTVRFYLNEDPKAVVAHAATSGMGQGVDDSAMSVWEMPSGIMVMAHESFTHPYAGSGIEVHGSEGSVFARDVMTQKPTGEVILVTKNGSQQIDFDSHNLYKRSVACFVDALKGNGLPTATGIDGVKSLAVALAVAGAAETGRRTEVDYAGF